MELINTVLNTKAVVNNQDAGLITAPGGTADETNSFFTGGLKPIPATGLPVTATDIAVATTESKTTPCGCSNEKRKKIASFVIGLLAGAAVTYFITSK